MEKISIAAISLIMMSQIAGCSGNGGNNSSSRSSPAADNSVKELSFEVMIRKFGNDPSDTLIQKEWQKEMEAYLGVKLNIKWNRIQWGRGP